VFKKRLPYILAVLMAAAALPASDDWLAQTVGRPLGGAWELSLALHQAQRESWALGDGWVWMQDADGQLKEQKLIEGELRLRWQASPAWSLDLAVPGVLSEFEPFSPAGTVSYPRLGDEAVRRSQGLGDLRLGLRWDAAPRPAGDFGFDVGLIAPSGQGPLEAPQPLASTGEGRWGLRAGAQAGRRVGAWQWRASVHGAYQAGREAQLSSAAPLAYAAAGPVYAPSNGSVWLDGRSSVDGALGLGWDWHVDDDSRHSLALSLLASQRSPVSVNGAAVDGTESVGVALQPELQARFGGFSALGGWQSPWLYARGLPAPDWGELFLRLDHAL
jgi:hypothetical protein